MQYFSMLIKPISSGCNLDCKYCFYKDEARKRAIGHYGLMEKTTMVHIIDTVLDHFKNGQSQITFAFQGGEPTLAGIDYFKRFFQYVNDHKRSGQTIAFNIQTNGLTIDDAWIELFKQYHVLVGLSIDGYSSIHDKYRLTLTGEKTFATILDHYHQMVQANIDVNILTVITHNLAQHAKALYDFYQKEKMEYIQLIPCLPPLNEKSVYAFRPSDYPKFFGELFMAYLNGLNHGYRPSINTFDQWMVLTNGYAAGQCGSNGYCAMQYVTEADGSVYPCDFYCLDDYQIGNWSNQDPTSLMLDDQTKRFLNENTTPKMCNTCKYLSICHGQCKRQRVCFMDETTSYCGIHQFLDTYGPTIQKIAQRLFNAR